jgi:hypothetical protein
MKTPTFTGRGYLLAGCASSQFTPGGEALLPLWQDS